MKLMSRVANARVALGVVVGLCGWSGAAHAQTASPTPTSSGKTWKSGESAFYDVFSFDFSSVAMSLGFGKLTDYDKAIAASPKDADVYCNRGAYYRTQKQYDKASADYQKAAKLDPKSIRPHRGLARVYEEQKNVAQALAEYGKAIALATPKTDELCARADYFGELGRNADALADYNQAVALQPADKWPYFYRANFYHRQKQFDKALLDYNKLVELDPRLFLDEQGKFLNEMKEYDKAIGSFTKALAINPKNAEALNGLGLAYMGTTTYDMAQTRFDAAIALSPKTAAYYANRGLNEVKSKNWTAAQRDLDQSIALDAKAGAPYFYRALLMVKKTQYMSDFTATMKTSVAADVSKAVQLDTTLFDAIYAATNEYSNDIFGREKGVLLLLGATQGAPQNPQAWTKLGDMQCANYTSKDAIDSYEKALKIEPKSLDALRGCASALFDSAIPYKDVKFLFAISYWQRYLVLKPSDIDALQKLGLSSYNAGHTADGIDTFRKIIALNDDGTKAYAHVMLGLGLALQKNKSDATTEVQTYIYKASVSQIKAAKSLFAGAVGTHPDNDELKAVAALIPDKTDETPDYSGIFFV